MTEHEIHRAVQYVTARTSYGHELVAAIVKTGFDELTAVASTSSQAFERDALFEYVCRWTMSRTRQPEPIVRDVLECAGRWLDDLYRTLAHENPDFLKDNI